MGEIPIKTTATPPSRPKKKYHGGQIERYGGYYKLTKTEANKMDALELFSKLPQELHQNIVDIKGEREEGDMMRKLYKIYATQMERGEKGSRKWFLLNKLLEKGTIGVGRHREEVDKIQAQGGYDPQGINVDDPKYIDKWKTVVAMYRSPNLRLEKKDITFIKKWYKNYLKNKAKK